MHAGPVLFDDLAIVIECLGNQLSETGVRCLDELGQVQQLSVEEEPESLHAALVPVSAGIPIPQEPDGRFSELLERAVPERLVQLIPKQNQPVDEALDVPAMGPLQSIESVESRHTVIADGFNLKAQTV